MSLKGLENWVVEFLVQKGQERGKKYFLQDVVQHTYKFEINVLT